jgi:hypothetical protein
MALNYQGSGVYNFKLEVQGISLISTQSSGVFFIFAHFFFFHLKMCSSDHRITKNRSINKNPDAHTDYAADCRLYALFI